MVKIFVGLKGSGKTKTLIEMANTTVDASKGTVVCIEKGVKLRYDVKYQARLINTEEFNQVVTEKAVLLDLYADWCGPCKMIAPMLDELSAKYEGQVTFVKVNVDNDPEVAQRFGVMSIPTLITFKDGQKVKQVAGFQPKPMLEKMISELL